MEERSIAISSELDLFTIPPVNIASDKSYYTEVTPVNSLDHNAPIIFSISDNEAAYIDLHNSFIYIKGNLTKNNVQTAAPVDDVIAAADICFPVNYFIGALFKEVSVQINGKKISDCNQLYHYKSYIEYLTSYSGEAKEESGGLSFFYKDKLGKYNETGEMVDNPGANARLKLVAGKSFEVAGRLHNDLFAQTRYLPGDLSIVVTCYVNDPKFYLMANAANTGALTFKFEKCSLFVKRLDITEKIRRGINEKRKNGGILTYPIKRGVVRYKTITQHSPSFSEKIVSNNEIPKRVIVSLVTHAAFSGNLRQHPYKFAPNNIKKIELHKGTDLSPFMIMDDLDFTNGLYRKAYISFLKGLGMLFQNDTLGLTPEEYASDQALFVFDLTKNGIDSEMFEIGENASINITGTFNTAPTVALVAIFYLEYDSLIAIGNETNIVSGDIEIE